MGCAVAIIGGLVAWCGILLAFWGFGSAYGEDYETAHVVLPIAWVVGLVGIGLVVAGIRSAFSGNSNEKAFDDGLNITPIEYVLCPDCGCPVVDGSKTCEWCGADVK